MTHFTDVDLRRWRDHGPGDDRARIVDHLAGCGSCASRYAAALRTAPLDVAEAADDASDFVAAGYQAAADHSARRARPWGWMVAGLAAAAVVALALVVPQLRAPSDEGLRFRGAQVHALAPAGATSGEVAFTWSSAIEAPRFRIEMGDASGVLYTTESAASPVRAPESIVRALKPGTDYWWTVTALEASGQPMRLSARQTFSIAPPR